MAQIQSEEKLNLFPVSEEEKFENDDAVKVPVSDSSKETNDGNAVDVRPVNESACDVCNNAPSKYTCPRCEIKSCSLICVKTHKKQLDCSGEREKTAFVQMTDYTDRHLLNDYRFLEDAGRTLYTHKNVPQNRQISMNVAPYHNKRSRLLMTAASKRGVRLKMMAGIMKKHKSNTSFYIISSDKIDWHIEWCFAASGCLVHHERVPETELLSEAARKYTNPVNFPHLRKPLEMYRKESVENCIFLLKVEGLPANRKRFFKLNPVATLKDNFDGHNLIEHPTIVVLPSSYNNQDYPLLQKDDFPFMDPGSMKHLTHQHPAFREADQLTAQVLDPNSNIYTSDAAR